MKNDNLKVGDRVDVSLKIKNSYDSKRGFSNGVIVEIRNLSDYTKCYYVMVDEQSTTIPYHNVQSSGHFIDSGWNIVKHIKI